MDRKEGRHVGNGWNRRKGNFRAGRNHKEGGGRYEEKTIGTPGRKGRIEKGNSGLKGLEERHVGNI
jgi:hypothetical protein